MPDIVKQYREDWSSHGFFGYERTTVQYAHDGIQKLKHNVPIPQNEFGLVDSSGASGIAQNFDATTSRVYTTITPTTAGTHTIYKRIQVPRHYASSIASGFGIVTRRAGAVTSIKLTLLRGGSADSTINGSNVSPGSASTWTAFTFTPGTSYSPGDYVTIKIEYVASANNAVDVADIEWGYINGRGNV